MEKQYAGGVFAVREATLTVADGELVVLVGPSGCGKSTTLRMVAGLEEITAGTIRIGDRVVNDVAPKDRDIAMVFQNYALYPHMTVYDNMGFGLKLRGIPRAEIDRRVREAAGILGLGEYLKRRPKALSGGQRQRVAMGRAIVRDPAVFLFDEPLSNLDAKMRVDMRREILHLHRRLRTTMLYVTHDQVEAMTLGDRIVVMREGRIEQVGDPGDVFDNPRTTFVARFIGTPPMNLFEGALRRENGALFFDGGEWRATLPPQKVRLLEGAADRRVLLGLRPRAFELLDAGATPGAGATPAWKARVDLTEMLGEELLLHLESGPHRLIVSTDVHARSCLHEVVQVVPKLAGVHVFDAETGVNLTFPITGGLA